MTKSRNVRSYVKAELRRRKLSARLKAKEATLEPLTRRLIAAAVKAKAAEAKLNGGQLACARRLLDAPPETLALLSTRCKPLTKTQGETPKELPQ